MTATVLGTVLGTASGTAQGAAPEAVGEAACDLPSSLRSIAVLVHSPVSMFEFGVACEVFGSDRTADGLPGFDFAVCTEHPGTLPASHAGNVRLARKKSAGPLATRALLTPHCMQ